MMTELMPFTVLNDAATADSCTLLAVPRFTFISGIDAAVPT